MFNKIKNKRGQTLLEVIVAIGVVLLVLISIIGLVLINIMGQKSSENKIIANNLAREGLEVFKNFRDSVVLQKIDFDQKFSTYQPAKHFYFLAFVPPPNPNIYNYNWDLRQSSSQSSATWADDTKIYIDSDKLYNYTGSTETTFKRRLVVDPICQLSTECANAASGVCESSDGSSVCTSTIGYRVKSQIQWVEGGQAVNFEAVGYLYNWK